MKYPGSDSNLNLVRFVGLGWIQAAWLLAACTGTPDGAVVMESDETRVSLKDLRLNSDGNKLIATLTPFEEPPRSIEIAAPIAFRFRNPVEIGPLPEGHATVLLWSGGRFHGRRAEGQGTGRSSDILLESPLFGLRSFLLYRVGAILLPGHEGRVTAELPGPEVTRDAVVLRSGERRKGMLLWLSSRSVSLLPDGSEPETVFPLSEVAAILPAPAQSRPADFGRVAAVVEAADGSVLRGRVHSLDDEELTFEDLSNLSFHIPRKAIAAIRFERSREQGPAVPRVGRQWPFFLRPDSPPPDAPPTVVRGSYRQIRTITSGEGFAFSPDETRLAYVSAREALEILEIASGRQVGSISVQVRSRIALPAPSFTIDGKGLVAQLEKGTLSFLDPSTGVETRRVSRENWDVDLERLESLHPYGTDCVALTGEGRMWTCMANQGGEHRVYRLAGQGRVLGVLEGTGLIGLGSIKGEESASLMYYDLRTYKWKRSVPLGTRVRCAILSQKLGQVFLVPDEVPGEIRVLRADTGEKLVSRIVREGSIGVLAVSADGAFVAAAGSDGTVLVLRTAGLEPFAEFVVESSPTRRRPDPLHPLVVLSATGRYLGVGVGTGLHLLMKE